MTGQCCVTLLISKQNRGSLSDALYNKAEFHTVGRKFRKQPLHDYFVAAQRSVSGAGCTASYGMDDYAGYAWSGESVERGGVVWHKFVRDDEAGWEARVDAAVAAGYAPRPVEGEPGR